MPPCPPHQKRLVFFKTGFLTSEVFDTNAPNYLVLASTYASKGVNSLGSYSVLYGGGSLVKGYIPGLGSALFRVA